MVSMRLDAEVVAGWCYNIFDFFPRRGKARASERDEEVDRDRCVCV